MSARLFPNRAIAAKCHACRFEPAGSRIFVPPHPSRGSGRRELMFFEELTNGAALQAGQGVTVHESALGVTPYIVL
jgi:hypothetical protein